MPLYLYKGLDADGKNVSGNLYAINEAELTTKLSSSGIDVYDISEKRYNSFFSPTLKDKDLIWICSYLGMFEKAGIPLLECIDDIRKNTDSSTIRNIMLDVHDSIRTGTKFSDALEKYPKIFDNVFVGLVRSGEKSGNLGDTFEQLERHYKWKSAIRAKIKKATYYPMFLSIVMIIMFSVMMIFVVPKLSVFLKERGIDLPWYSKGLIAVSDAFAAHGAAIGATPIVLFIAIKIAAVLSKDFRIFVDKLKLGLPVFGSLIMKIEMSRFCHFFSMAYQSGIDIITCFETSKDVMQNAVLRNSILDAKALVVTGKSMADSLESTGRFPTFIIKVFKVAERTGNLQQALKNVNSFYDKEIAEGTDAMISMLQPTLTVIMGAVMGWITVSVFAPIYMSIGSTT